MFDLFETLAFITHLFEYGLRLEIGLTSAMSKDWFRADDPTDTDDPFIVAAGGGLVTKVSPENRLDSHTIFLTTYR